MKRINKDDIENALKLYCENEEVKNRNDTSFSDYLINTMYV